MTKSTRNMFEHIIRLNELQVLTLKQQTKDVQALLDDDDSKEVQRDRAVLTDRVIHDALPACTVPNCSVCATIKHNEPAFRYKKRWPHWRR